MAHLVKQQMTRYVDRAGKHVPKGSSGARKVTEESAKWYGDGNPDQCTRRVPLATEKGAARRMLADGPAG